jgi:aryl-alcohol dehydrogenase-like predicted oxidoreductase
MRYRRFQPLDRDLSRLVLGTMHFRDDAMAWPRELLDEWAAIGGNVLDCAHNYGEGSSERAVGRWLRDSGLRQRTVVLTKGAHPDERGARVTPEAITADLRESLQRLDLDSVDLYLLHRDDPRVPVGPLLEVLTHHRREGRIGAFGASNWTAARLAEARRHAQEHGLDAFSCSSPNLSLARQNVPPWPGCVSASPPQERAWYEATQTPVFAWSSQAGGFFALPPELVARGDTLVGRVYASPENDERRRRAVLLADRKGVKPHQIALAWVLHQPFPTYALIGPASLAELHDSVEALDVDLTAEELDWLDLGARRPEPLTEETAR